MFLHTDFKLNGKHYNQTQLLKYAHETLISGANYEKQIALFLIDWLDERTFITVQTSGSTGTPKQIEVTKTAMLNSALATGTFFNLNSKQTALHCLPSNYIAGKLMLVRALVLGLELDCISPQLPLVINPKISYHFCAMTPMQLTRSIELIKNIKTLIVGGMAVSDALKRNIETCNTTIFETYGMTETVSHIALKQINNFKSKNKTNQNLFKVLPNITITQDHRGCLVINAPKLAPQPIITNDMVTLQDAHSFEWLGRFDNVINSGGIKLYPEVIEAKLKSNIPMRFFIASESNTTFGEQIIMIVEGKNTIFEPQVFSNLSPFEIPKAIYFINAFSETESGKIQREKTLQLLKLNS